MPDASPSLGLATSTPTLGLAGRESRDIARPRTPTSPEDLIPDISSIIGEPAQEKPNAFKAIGILLQNFAHAASGGSAATLPSRQFAQDRDAQALRRIQRLNAELNLDENLRERALKLSDNNNLEIIDAKFKDYTIIVNGLGENEDIRNLFVEAAGEDGVFSFDEFLEINSQLQGTDLHFSPEEIDTLRRNPERLPSFLLSPEESRELTIRNIPTDLERQREERAQAAEGRAQSAERRAAAEERRKQIRFSERGREVRELTDEEGRKVTALVDTVNGNVLKTLFTGPKPDVNFDNQAAQGALLARSRGQEVDPNIFGEEEAKLANSLEPKDADEFLADLRQEGGEDTTIVKLQDARDEALVAGDFQNAQEIQNQIDKIGTVVGRTSEDAAAAQRQKTGAKIEEEEAQRQAKPVPNDIRRLADISPDVASIGDAEARGLTVELKPEDKSKLLNAEVVAREGIRLADNMIDQVKGRPEIIGAPGFLVRAADDILHTVVGLYRAVGDKVEASTEVEHYGETLNSVNGLSVDSHELRSFTVALAFAMARQREGGRLTDQDVERALQTIGATSSNPTVWVNNLQSVQERMDEVFADRIEVFIGNRPNSLLPGGEEQTINFQDMSEEEFLKAAEEQGFFLQSQ